MIILQYYRALCCAPLDGDSQPIPFAILVSSLLDLRCASLLETSIAWGGFYRKDGCETKRGEGVHEVGFAHVVGQKCTAKTSMRKEAAPFASHALQITLIVIYRVQSEFAMFVSSRSAHNGIYLQAFKVTLRRHAFFFCDGLANCCLLQQRCFDICSNKPPPKSIV